MKTSESFQRPSPVVLSSSCDVANGSTNVPNYAQLSYPFRKAIAIDEIRFDLSVNAEGLAVAPITGGSPQLGALVYGRFQLGRHYLNRDDVPLWLLGTKMTGYEEGVIDATLSTPFAFSHYRWKFPEPLYVEAGETLRSTFSRATDGLLGIPQSIAANITVQVSYVGRVVPPNTPRPKTLMVPYVAPFITPWSTTATYQQSNEYNLFNPFDTALRVQRLTGRVLNVGSAGGKFFNELRQFTPSSANGGIELQIFDSWGGKVVNDLTGPSDIMDIARSSWTFDTLMPPKGQYDLRAWNLPVKSGSSGDQLHVAMVGVREEAL